MSMVAQTSARSEEKYRVTRSRRNVAWTGAGALVVVVVLALFPDIVYSGTTTIMVQAFIVLILASMWNLMAGYAGLVSVGQQAFVGLGAYFVLILAQHGTSPFGGLVVAAIGCGVAAIPLWWLVSRLRSGYFAIATWVLATTVMLFIEKFPSIGGGTGMSLPGLGGYDPTLLIADTYWTGLAVSIVALGTVYLLLRGRLGTIEGPILGTIVYIVLQQTLQSYNAWYLIVLGVAAIATALFARRGLWGLIDDHLHVRLFPVGYWLWAPGSGGRRSLAGLRGLGRGGAKPS